MRTVEDWCKTNAIEINRKKSGVMILNDSGVEATEIRGYSIVREYRYLGVIINNLLNCPRQTTTVAKKVELTSRERDGY